MEIKYEIVPEDITYYSKEAAVRTSFLTLQAIMWVVMILLFMMSDMLMAVLSVFLNDGSVKIYSVNIIPRMIVGMTLMGISYVALMTFSKKAAKKFQETSGKNGLFCEHTLELGDAGFTETTHVSQNFISWEAVKEIEETKNYVALLVRAGSSYFIPKRAFSSSEEIRDFVSIAQNHIEKASSMLTPPPSITEPEI